MENAGALQTSAKGRRRKIGVGRECPKCGSTDTIVTSTRTHPTERDARMRYYRCLQCQRRFRR